MDRKQFEAVRHDEERRMVLMHKTALGQRLSASEAEELKQIAMRKEARVNDKRRLLEAPYAHLPPLPPVLPDYRDTTAFGPLDMEFFTWCIGGQKNAVEGYIEAQEDPARESLLQRGLASACEGGRAQVVRYLLQKGAHLHGLAVEYACRRCDLALFEVFIEHGWHPNQQIPSAEGVIGVALPHCTRDLPIVQLLLAHGADPNLGVFDIRKRSGLGPTPPMDRRSGDALTRAARRGNIEVIDLLLQHGAVLEWSTPLHSALSAWPQNRPVFVHFLHLGADPNKNIHFPYGTLWEGGTPLLRAIRYHNWEAVELLLESGADPEAFNLYACVAKMDTAEMKSQGKSLMNTFMALVEKVKQKNSS
ncbi:ankyrin repeat-containing domain protein [Ustulina deusta]|nr:ankyrin repeat-containing domain protein [Ustulina deusta]